LWLLLVVLMARLERRGKEFVLVFSLEDQEKLGFSDYLSFEVVSTQKGFIVLFSDAAKEKNAPGFEAVPLDSSVSLSLQPSSFGNPLDEKLLGMLSDKTLLPKRIVGSFERQLSAEELKRFRELLKEGVVEPFRLNEKYKNEIYRVSPGSLPEKKESQVTTKKDLSDPKSADDLSMTKNGFVIIRNEKEAKDASSQLYVRIKAGEVRGIKSFDGSFYVIETRLYRDFNPLAMDFFRDHPTATVEELAAGVKTGVFFARTLCEFLKDDGFVFEKKKGLYKLID